MHPLIKHLEHLQCPELVQINEFTICSQALVIETTLQSGGYILGFRVDAPGNLEQLHLQIMNLWRVCAPACCLAGVRVGDWTRSRSHSSS